MTAADAPTLVGFLDAVGFAAGDFVDEGGWFVFVDHARRIVQVFPGEDRTADLPRILARHFVSLRSVVDVVYGRSYVLELCGRDQRQLIERARKRAARAGR